MFNDSLENEVIYIFKTDNVLKVSTNSIIKNYSYEFIIDSDNIIIKDIENAVEVLYDIVLVKDDYLLLRQSFNNSVLAFINKTKSKDLTKKLIRQYFEEATKIGIDTTYYNTKIDFQFENLEDESLYKGYLKKAEQFFDFKDYEQALAFYNKALSLNPTNYELLEIKAICLARMGKGKECYNTFNLIKADADTIITLKIAMYLFDANESVFAQKIIDEGFVEKFGLDSLIAAFVKEDTFINMTRGDAIKDSLKLYNIEDLLRIYIENGDYKIITNILFKFKENEGVKLFESLIVQDYYNAQNIELLKTDYNIVSYHKTMNKLNAIINFFNINYPNNKSKPKLIHVINKLDEFRNNIKGTIKYHLNIVNAEILEIQEGLYTEFLEILKVKDYSFTSIKPIINVLNKTGFDEINDSYKKTSIELIKRIVKRENRVTKIVVVFIIITIITLTIMSMVD